MHIAFQEVGPGLTLLHESNLVTVRIVNIHFPIAPGLVHRFERDLGAASNQFGMQSVHIFD